MLFKGPREEGERVNLMGACHMPSVPTRLSNPSRCAQPGGPHNQVNALDMSGDF